MTGALGLRLAAQGLAVPFGSVEEAVRTVVVQDSPPGSAALALHARVAELAPEALERRVGARRLVRLYTPRTATAVLAAEDVATFTAGLRPSDEEGWRAIADPAQHGSDRPAAEAVALAADAVGAALDGRVLSRDELHEELRHRLPRDLLPWCPGCGSHHARRGLLCAATLHGVLCHAGRRGRRPAFARTDQWLGAPVVADGEAAAAQLVRRYVHAYGPSTARRFAEWAGIGRAQAARAWALVAGELVRAGNGDVLAADAGLLDAPPPARGVRLLPPGDPLLLARDRDALVADRDVQRRVWRPVGAPGVVLADGRLAGVWRARRQGRRLAVTVEELAPVDRGAIREAAAGVAPHRGAATAEVRFGG